MHVDDNLEREKKKCSLLGIPIVQNVQEPYPKDVAWHLVYLQSLNFIFRVRDTEKEKEKEQDIIFFFSIKHLLRKKKLHTIFTFLTLQIN